jgi:hypothetical protein
MLAKDNFRDASCNNSAFYPNVIICIAAYIKKKEALFDMLSLGQKMVCENI